MKIHHRPQAFNCSEVTSGVGGAHTGHSWLLTRVTEHPTVLLPDQTCNCFKYHAPCKGLLASLAKFCCRCRCAGQRARCLNSCYSRVGPTRSLVQQRVDRRAAQLRGWNVPHAPGFAEALPAPSEEPSPVATPTQARQLGSETQTRDGAKLPGAPLP